MTVALWIATILAQTHYTPAEAHAIFVQGNDAFYRQEFPAAADHYRKLLNRGFGGPDVLFNLGTTYLAAGQLGEAVLFLERARRAGGSAEDIDAQLAMARSRQLDQVVGAQAQAPFIERVAVALNERWVSWTFLLSWSAAFVLLLGFRFRPARRRLSWLMAAVACLAIALPSGGLMGMIAYVQATVIEAVVLAPSLQARQLPRDAAPVAFEAHAGLKVKLVEREGGFVKIRLPNGLEGWTLAEGVEEI